MRVIWIGESVAEERIYLVYDDSHEDGESRHVIAKNRKEARARAGIASTHVSWRPWLKNVNGEAVDEFGNSYGKISPLRDID